MKQLFKSALAFFLAVSMVFGFIPMIPNAVVTAQATQGSIATEDLYIRDPFVLAENGTYYLYGTRGFGQFDVFTSTDLKNWNIQDPCFVGTDDFWGNAVANSTAEGAEAAYWAPEVHKYNDAYYMLATFTQDTATANQQASAILKADNPLGPFVPWSEGPITPAGHSCLDATLYVENGVPYLIYAHEWQCACRNYNGKGSMAYIQLSEDLKSTVGISCEWFTADALVSFWEQLFGGTKAPRVTDGPFVYTKDGQKYLLWASGLDLDGTGTYVQLATPFAAIGSDIDLQKDTVKLYTNDGGHAMVFTDLRGVDTLVLHTPNSGDCRTKYFNVLKEGTQLTLTDRVHPSIVWGLEGYNTVHLGEGKVTYTATWEAQLELNAHVGAEDNAYMEATLKKDDAFQMDDLRYGFRFGGLEMNIISNSDGLALQITDWNTFETYPLNAQQIAAFEGEGLRVAAARVDGRYQMYAGFNGGMLRVLDVAMEGKENTEFNLTLNTWPNAKNAEYTDITYRIGEDVLPGGIVDSVYNMNFDSAETGDYLVQDSDGLWMDRYEKGWSWVDDGKFLVLSGAEGDASVDFWFNNVPIGSTIAFDFRMPTTSGGWDRLAIALGSSDLAYSWRFEQWQGWTSIKYPDTEGVEQTVNEAFAIDVWYCVKMDWNGNTVSVKLWERGTQEPADYTFTTQNGAFTADNKVRFNYVTNAQSYLHLDNIQMYSTSAQKNVQVIMPDAIETYATFAEAAANVGEGYIKLLTSIDEEVTVDSVTVDLNGKNLSGITATGTVYAFDSYANNHSDVNLGKLTVTGDVASDWFAPNGNRYIALQGEDGSYTMHHIYVGITKLSLATAVTGFGYKAEFWCDPTVQAMIESESYSLWLTEDMVATRSLDDYKQIVTLRLQNFDIENYGASKVSAKVSMKLTNGMVIESGVTAYSMQDMVELISANLEGYSSEQITAVQNMLEGYTAPNSWNISNLLSWTKETENA